MRARWVRRAATAVVSGALLTSFMQVPAFAVGHGKAAAERKADPSPGFSPGKVPKPPTGPAGAIADRQKLPRGRKVPPARRVRELTSLRTSSARFWRMSDGTTQAVVSAVPDAYRSGGGWKAIDTSVGASSRRGYALANTSNLARTYFGADGGHLVRFEAGGGRSVSLGLEGAPAALKPVARGDTVTYAGVAPGTDASYRVGAGAVKEDLVLAHKPAGPVSYVFDLDTQGLTPRQRADGAIWLYGSGETGRPVVVIPAAVMSQAPVDSDSPVTDMSHGRVVQKLVKHGSGWRITLTPDAKWLSASGRRFPVTVDPTLVLAPTPSTSQDVMVDSTQPTTNLNGSWQLGVGTTATGTLRSLLKFPLSGIPSGTPITSAQLGVYYNQVHTANTNDVVVEAHRATGSWDASTADWSNTSALSGELSGTTVQLDDGDAGTAAHGSWPYSTNSAFTQYGINGDYAYNKDTVAGDTYTGRGLYGQRCKPDQGNT